MPVYKSLTLAPGDSYVLPAGATIVSLSNPDIFSSQNGCANTDNLQKLGCYICPIPIAADDGNNRQYWEAQGGGDPSLIGYVLNGVYTAFSTSFGSWDPGRFNDPTALKNEILNIPGVAFVDYSSTNNDFHTGTLNYILITTISSIANNLELVVNTTANRITPPTDAKGYFKFVTYASMNGYSGLPTCPLT